MIDWLQHTPWVDLIKLGLKIDLLALFVGIAHAIITGKVTINFK